MNKLGFVQADPIRRRKSQQIRLYEPTSKVEDELSDADQRASRLHALVLQIAAILAPLPESSLRAALHHLGHAALIKSGQSLHATGQNASSAKPGFIGAKPTGAVFQHAFAEEL